MSTQQTEFRLSAQIRSSRPWGRYTSNLCLLVFQSLTEPLLSTCKCPGLGRPGSRRPPLRFKFSDLSTSGQDVLIRSYRFVEREQLTMPVQNLPLQILEERGIVQTASGSVRRASASMTPPLKHSSAPTSDDVQDKPRAGTPRRLH